MAHCDSAATPGPLPPPPVLGYDMSYMYAQDLSCPSPDTLVSATLFRTPSLNRTASDSWASVSSSHNPSTSSASRRTSRSDSPPPLAPLDDLQPSSPLHGESRSHSHSRSIRASMPGFVPPYLTSAMVSEPTDRPRSMAEFSSTKIWQGCPLHADLDAPFERPNVSPRRLGRNDTHGESPLRINRSRYGGVWQDDWNTSPGAMTWAPAYPSPGLRRSQTARAATVDTALADEDDVSLFAQATAGLGPDTMFGSPIGSQSETPHARTATSANTFQEFWLPAPPIPQPNLTRSPSYISQASPSQPYLTHHHAHLQGPNLQNQRISSAPSNAAVQQLAPPYTSVATLDELDPWGNTCPPPDDELPDYASSQAQAQASQRVEAARRAQELQRRWQQSTYRPRYA